MRKVVDYKLKWVIRKNKAVKVYSPIYEEAGQGGGVEATKKIKRDEYGNPVYENGEEKRETVVSKV